MKKIAVVVSFENIQRGSFRSFQESLDYVIPARTAGIQVHMDVSGRIHACQDAGRPSLPA